jgi:acetamidase/formamidase
LGVTPNYIKNVSSIPPSIFGGNIDNWRAGKYSSIYLPVQVEGAKFIVGDSHASQGDSELSGTAIEFSMTGKFRFTLIKKNDNPFGLNSPIIETPKEWIIQGFSYPDYLKDLGEKSQELIEQNSSLDTAMRDAYRKTNIFLTNYMKLTEDEAVSIMSVAVDFGITQIVDMNYGVHAVIKKDIFKKSRSFTKTKKRKNQKKIKTRKNKNAMV